MDFYMKTREKIGPQRILHGILDGDCCPDWLVPTFDRLLNYGLCRFFGVKLLTEGFPGFHSKEAFCVFKREYKTLLAFVSLK
jgi:hypothetical protein